MSNWVVDDRDYQKAYFTTMEAAKGFDRELATAISRPSVVALTPEYLASPKRFMIFGQETFASNEPIAGQEPWDAYTAALGGYIAFNFSIGGNAYQQATPFWRAFREVCAAVGVAAPRGAIWSNLIKVQKVQTALSESTSFIQLARPQREEVLEWQRELFKQEMLFAKPDCIILFTGPAYDPFLSLMLPDIELCGIGGILPAELSVGTSKRFGCNVVRIYHPSYLQRIKRWDFLEIAARTVMDMGR